MIDVDKLAQEIRRVDGNHSLGAGALAEALTPFISAALHPHQEGEKESSETPPPQTHSVGPADQIIGQIEELFPNWRAYRDLVDCITCELHDMRKRAGEQL